LYHYVHTKLIKILSNFVLVAVKKLRRHVCLRLQTLFAYTYVTCTSQGGTFNSHYSGTRVIEHALDQSNATLQSKGGRMLNKLQVQNVSL